MSSVTIEAPTLGPVRMTIPTQEAMTKAGNSVERSGRLAHGTGAELWTVTLRSPPSGVVLVLIGQREEQHRGLRMANEPPYPGEWRDGIAWYERGEVVPCPRCGAALVWYEAGYVPGTRICLAGHGAQLSADGRSATPARVSPPGSLERAAE